MEAKSPLMVLMPFSSCYYIDPVLKMKRKFTGPNLILGFILKIYLNKN
jgi:hypothetical protein